MSIRPRKTWTLSIACSSQAFCIRHRIQTGVCILFKCTWNTFQARSMLGHSARLSNIWKTRKRLKLSDVTCGADIQAAHLVRMQEGDFTYQQLIWAAVFIRDLCTSGFREAGFEISHSCCPACLSQSQKTFLIIYLWLTQERRGGEC